MILSATLGHLQSKQIFICIVKVVPPSKMPRQFMSN